jgi:hypothetical protein
MRRFLIMRDLPSLGGDAGLCMIFLCCNIELRKNIGRLC